MPHRHPEHGREGASKNSGQRQTCHAADLPVSDRIRARLAGAGVRFNANDNIAAFLREGMGGGRARSARRLLLRALGEHGDLAGNVCEWTASLPRERDFLELGSRLPGAVSAGPTTGLDAARRNWRSARR